MDPNTTTLERAFQLAQSGKYASVEDIRRQLNAEGYSGYQILGPALLAQLKALIQNAIKE